VYDTHYREQMVHITSWTVFLANDKGRMAGISWEVLINIQGTYCAKTREIRITLIKSTRIRRFSRWSGGGGYFLLSDARSLKTSSRDYQAQVYSD
jgi:hypothetical protein